jgi:hypothetical protein
MANAAHISHHVPHAPIDKQSQSAMKIAIIRKGDEHECVGCHDPERGAVHRHFGKYGWPVAAPRTTIDPLPMDRES